MSVENINSNVTKTDGGSFTKFVDKGDRFWRFEGDLEREKG